MRTFAIVNQKGGSGKTTCAINLAAIFAHRGQRTLLVDMDPQSHCATGLGVPEGCVEKSVSEVLLHEDLSKLEPSEFLWEAAGNLDLLPSTMRLAGLEAPGGGLYQLPDRDRRLARVLELLAGRYDRCLIDCPPTIGLLTFNALRAARETLIPVETGFFALRGAEKQCRAIQQLIDRLGHPIACHLIPTLYDADSTLATDILAALRRRFAGQIVPVVIGEHEVLREAVSFGQPVIEYAPQSSAAKEYEKLADWLEDHPPRRGVEIEVMMGRRLGSNPPLPAILGPPPSASGAPRGQSRAAELARRLRLGQQHEQARATNPAARDAPTSALTAQPPHASRLVDSQPAAIGTALGTAAAVASATSRSPAFGAQTTEHGVRFVQPGDAQCSIVVAGDFNQWSATANPLRYSPQLAVHHAIVDIPPGRYQYRLVIDGVWQADPYNANVQLNEYGEHNSVLVVGQSKGST
ncbi:MAG: AAA family ATPase [Phycisphaerales bacterium]